jgi:hypothetical protein
MYPTLEQVEAARHHQICSWYRFLPSPGIRAIYKENFQEVLDAEVTIMNRIAERLKELGGFTPGISKSLGW